MQEITASSFAFWDSLDLGLECAHDVHAAVHIDAGVHLDGGSLQSDKEYDIC